MKHSEKIEWMIFWCHQNKVILELEGECGIMRECVGIISNDTYPDYEWYDAKYKRIDNNGDVWVPEDAYHKHPCVAVLGRGEEAESQLYDWLKWFSDNGFTVETGTRDSIEGLSRVALALGEHMYIRMVKK